MEVVVVLTAATLLRATAVEGILRVSAVEAAIPLRAAVADLMAAAAHLTGAVADLTAADMVDSDIITTSLLTGANSGRRYGQ
jgi:hypothetical protein